MNQAIRLIIRMRLGIANTGKMAHTCSIMHILQIYEHPSPNYLEIEYIFVIISIEFILGE